jgi:large subunit ribosomal protein L46
VTPISSQPLPEHEIKAGILLSRPPLLTRSLHPFENAYFFYQRRLNERLALPFTRYFYHKPDSPADISWKARAKARNGSPARDLGGYRAFGPEGWNDEVLVGDEISQPRSMVNALLEDARAETSVEGNKETIDMPLSRVTEADKTMDFKRLDRKLNRTLYLAVKRQGGGWGFPAGKLEGRENLYQVRLSPLPFEGAVGVSFLVTY